MRRIGRVERGVEGKRNSDGGCPRARVGFEGSALRDG